MNEYVTFFFLIMVTKFVTFFLHYGYTFLFFSSLGFFLQKPTLLTRLCNYSSNGPGVLFKLFANLLDFLWC